MSSPAAMDEAYRSFLRTSDLEAWTGCVETYRDLFAGMQAPGDARPLDILHALTIALYLGWLADRCGESELRDRTNASFDALAARIDAGSPYGGRDGALIQAVVAAAGGYSATARMLVSDLAPQLPVEIAVLTAPRRPAQRAAALQSYISNRARCDFIPALFFYASALIDLGYHPRATEILAPQVRATSSALVADLQGQLLELDGSWREAREIYRDSKWAAHTYRHAICDLILGEPIERLATWSEDKVKKFIAGMMDFSAETDRAGIVRSASFVRACRWSGFDNWLVHFELGRLGFQRRHHSEAERHFAAALRAAPEPYRFAISSVRFTNLTWLGESMDIDMNPEVREAGHAALQERATEGQRAHIRTWLGRFEGESAVIEPVLTTSDDFERGNAHDLRGSVPEAIECWSSCIKSFTPRAFFRLVRIFASCGFQRTATRLAEAAALESADHFFHTWELAGALAGVVERQPTARPGDRPLALLLANVEARMEALVESEFQNAIRAFGYFVERRMPAPARRMLTRAERLAEGPEELLLLAIARRTVTGGGWDPRALDALDRARQQSSDRFERLLIARELVTLGDVASARTILVEDGVLSSQRNLTPVEYVLALRCATVCCDDDERAQLEEAAVDALARDIAAGQFVRHADPFIRRLGDTVDARIGIAVPTAASEASVLGESVWRTLTKELERLEGEQQTAEELRLLNEQVEALSNNDSPHARLALWSLHRNRFNAHVRRIQQVRPIVPDDETPLARDTSPVRARARTLAQLWRAHLLARRLADAAQRLDDIRAFLAEDQRLTERWDRLREAEAEPWLRHALRYAEQGGVLLADIASEERTIRWPPLLGIGKAVVEDAREASERLRAATASEHRAVPV